MRTIKALLASLRGIDALIEGQRAQIQAADQIQKQLATIIDRTPVPGAQPMPVEPISAPPTADVPYPIVDMAAPNPVASIMQGLEFGSAVSFFSSGPSAAHALVSPHAQALLYCMLRNLKPDHVVEIGTYRASTTEALCRALAQNGRGIVHTVDPFGAHSVPGIIAGWPPGLQLRVSYLAVNSMAFFAECRFHAGLVFIDGNHDFEFALFDIHSATRIVQPGGFVVIDNIGQPGPFFAARDFCKGHPEWIDLGGTLSRYRDGFPFDPHRVALTNTDFLILRAPLHMAVHRTPFSPGTFDIMELNEVSVAPVGQPSGALFLQFILRTFSNPPTELAVERHIELDGSGVEAVITFDPPIRPTREGTRFTVEPWLSWSGPAPLKLKTPPVLR